jgi:hypothetical protein
MKESKLLKTNDCRKCKNCNLKKTKEKKIFCKKINHFILAEFNRDYDCFSYEEKESE